MAIVTPIAPLGVVAGSGIELRGLLSHVARTQAFSEIPGLAAGNVAGHEGRFIHGDTAGAPVVLQCGRLHCYEGLDYHAATATVDALHAFGVKAIVFTNAAGGLLPDMRVGDWLAVEQVRLFLPRTGTPHWPHAPESIAPRFQIAECEHAGAYIWVLGPNYETRAEIRALQALGGAAVGMSAAPELQRCQELGIPAAVISCITNNCCAPAKLSHTDVIEAAAAASQRAVERLRRLFVEGALPAR